MTNHALIDRLYLCLKDCSTALAAELNDRYRDRDRYEGEMRRYDQAMQTVREAEALLAELDKL